MYNRKKLFLIGSAAILIMAAGIEYSHISASSTATSANSAAVESSQQVKSSQSTQKTESSKVAEAATKLGDYNTSRDQSTYSSRGDIERGSVDEPDMDFHGTEEQQSHVDSKLRIGDWNDEVKEMQKKLIKMGFLNEDATGFFGILTNDAVVDFQVQMGLLPDGIVGTETLKAVEEAVAKGVTASKPQKIQEQAKPVQNSQTQVPLKEKTSSTKKAASAAKPIQSSQQAKSGTDSKIELLSWFGGAENVFSIGSVAKVTDVDSGLSFNAKRTYGYNHADVEALTAEDAKIMKKIAGGSWNWTRRAVIVEVNGRRLAASMAPMPHAGLDSKAANIQVSGRSGGYGSGVNLDNVKGNDMDGHFDIHFYNSKTHSSNKVDSQHQAMVQKAYKSEK